MGRVISMTLQDRRALESRPDISVGVQASLIWTTMVFQTSSWLPAMFTPKWNEAYRNIRTKRRAPYFGIWAKEFLKNSFRRPGRVWRRPTVAGDALLETSTMMGIST